MAYYDTASGFPDLGPLLNPESIVIVGASPRPGNLGGVAARLLRQHGFPGTIATVHPKADALEGVPCYASLDDMDEPADLALLAVPAAATPQVVRDCAAVGTTAGIIWSGGFAESAEGVELQDELVEACRQTGFRLLGPNSLGIIDTHVPMTATFASFLWELEALVAGDIAMVSQSGGLATIAQALALRLGFGFRSVISTGNEAVLTMADFIHELASDPQVNIIACYLEGVEDGDRFIAALEAARRSDKPVVVLKAGATEASARAAVAHTGALVGGARVWRAVFEEFGVIQVASLEELLDVVLLLSGIAPEKRPRGRGLAAVTFGGGMGVLAADQAAASGLSTPQLAEATRRELQPLVPSIASLGNPIDLTPQTYLDPHWIQHLPAALDLIAADPSIDVILIMAGPMATGGDEVASTIIEFRDRVDKPVFVAWPLPPRGVPERLRDRGLYVLDESARTIRALGRWAGQADAVRGRVDDVAALDFQWEAHVPAASPGLVLSEHDCHRLLDEAGLPTADGHLVESADAAVATAEAVGYPVVMKGISSAVTHRAAAGLLALGIDGPATVRATFDSLVDRAEQLGVSLDGVYVQQMLTDGDEVFVSAFRDPVFGLIVSCGAGGVLTEAIGDIALQRGPLDRTGALTLLSRVRTLAPLLEDPDGTRAVALADFVARLSRFAAAAPWRRFVLEVNPVKWTVDAAVAIDGLLVIEDP